MKHIPTYGLSEDWTQCAVAPKVASAKETEQSWYTMRSRMKRTPKFQYICTLYAHTIQPPWPLCYACMVDSQNKNLISLLIVYTCTLLLFYLLVSTNASTTKHTSTVDTGGKCKTCAVHRIITCKNNVNRGRVDIYGCCINIAIPGW